MFLERIYETDEFIVSNRCPIKYLHPLEIRRKEKGFPSFPKGGYYAIKYGYDKELNRSIYNWIAYSWEECSYYTQGVKRADFKRFDSFNEARRYFL